MNQNQVLALYKESAFEKKYKDTYVSDIIRKEVFGENIGVHDRGDLKRYSQVHQFNVDVLHDLLNLLVKDTGLDDTYWI